MGRVFEYIAIGAINCNLKVSTEVIAECCLYISLLVESLLLVPARTVNDAYSRPRIEDKLNSLAGAKCVK